MVKSVETVNSPRFKPFSSGSEEFQVELAQVRLDWVNFAPNRVADPRKIIIFFPGWPMLAESPATWELPGYLSDQSSWTTYSINTLTSVRKPKASYIEARASQNWIRGILPYGGELIIVSHPEGHLRGSKTAALLQQEEPQIKVRGVAAISPMGFYNQSFADLVKNFVVNEPKIEKDNTNPNEYHMPLWSFMGEMAKGIWEDIKTNRFVGYPAMLAAQMREMINVDSALVQVTAPYLILAPGLDLVSDYRKYLPQVEVLKRIAQSMTDAQLREWIITSGKWEHLPDKEKAKFRSIERFIEYYEQRFRVGEAMVDVSRARSQYLSDKVLPNAESVRLIRIDKFSSHISGPTERPKQVAHVIARTFGDRITS